MFIFLQSIEKGERDRLVLFIQKLVLSRENARELVNSGGLKVLVDLLSLAHLHTSRSSSPSDSKSHL
jgi:DnaJ family protein C protein 13